MRSFIKTIASVVLLAGLVLPCVADAQSSLPPCSQNKRGSWTNCQGTLTFPSGNKYVGEFRDNKFSGWGTYAFASGNKYVGEFKDDKFSGQGTYFFTSGNKYVGEFKDDKFNGQGTYIFVNGKKYVGQFEGDKFSGQGTYTFPSGNKYVGEFRDDKFNGQGTFSFPNGERYVGQFKDGNFDGQGTYTFPSGQKHVGEYRNDQRNGQGTFTFPDGRKYVGEFKDGKYDGRGTLYASDGSTKQAGIWKNDEFVQAIAPAPPASAALPPSVAPSASSPLRRIALVIGNSNYQNEAPLKNPGNDVSLLAASLRKAGFQSVIVKKDQTREQLISTILEFATQADSADWAMIYYSGHGIEYNGVNYMIPVDARLKVDRDIDLETVDVNRVTSALEGARKLRLLILDSCRSNPFMGGMRRTVGSRSIGRGLAPMEPDTGTLVVYAAKHGQEALDGAGENSPFAEALAKRILTPNLDVRRLFDLVRDDVMDVTNRKQQPFSYGSLSGREDFYFVQR